MSDNGFGRKNIGPNLKRQFKNLVKGEDNLANAIGFFAVAALLLVAGAFTKMAFLGLVGGGCLLLGLERLVRRSAGKSGGQVSDLKAKSDELREKHGK